MGGYKLRGFEPVRKEFRKNTEYHLPKRSTKSSAGYDFVAPIQIILHPHEHSPIIPTDIKARMGEDKFLACHIRSSLGMKKGISLTNTTGIIDSDYYSNPDNDGNICFQLKNNSEHTVIIQKGEKVFQGIFQKYLKVDNDDTVVERTGGIGSTGEKEKITIDASEYKEDMLNEARDALLKLAKTIENCLYFENMLSYATDLRDSIALHELFTQADESLTDTITDYVLNDDWEAADFSISLYDNKLKMTCNLNGDVTYATKCKEDRFDLEKAVMVALLKQFGVNYGLVDGIIKRSPYLREGDPYYYIEVDNFNEFYVEEGIWGQGVLESIQDMYVKNLFKSKKEAKKALKKIKEII